MEEALEFRRWDELIPDALGLIFKSLPLEEVLQVIPLVCKSWCKVIEGPHCWQKLDILELSMRPHWNRPNIGRMLRTLITRSAGSLLELRVAEVDDQMLSFIAEHAASLQILTLKWSSISDSKVAQAASNLTSLTTLDLSYCDDVSTSAFESIGANCKKLTSLTWCKRPPAVEDLKKILNDPTVCEEALTIARTMPKLKHLVLFYITINESFVVDVLSSGCPELELLDVVCCRGVDSLDFKLLERKYPRVKVLCPGNVDMDAFFSEMFSDDNSGDESDEYYNGKYYEDYDYDGENYGFEN